LDNTFDAVVGTRFMYMMTIEEKKQIISEVRRVLKPGGVVVLHFNNGFWGLKKELFNLLHGKKVKISQRYLWPGQVKSLFKNMCVERIVGIKLFKLNLISKLLGKRFAFFLNRFVHLPYIGFLSSSYLLVKAIKK
jgi:SAM-dependent methyltransferase